MIMTPSWIAIAALAIGAFGRDVPENVRSFYDRIKNGKCSGGTVLQDDFYSSDDGSKSFAYCQDDHTGAIYLHGEGSAFANMDVDCDGSGRCGNSADQKSETRWQSFVQSYSDIAGSHVDDLDANNVPYVVFGNEGSAPDYTTFDPRAHNVQPLSVMAVVCGDQMIYGVWGDTNGDDGKPLIGEASISLAKACYGDDMNGASGHEEDDILYIAFPGSVDDTVHKHANWAAGSLDDFEGSIEEVDGRSVQQLVRRIDHEAQGDIERKTTALL